MLRLFTSNSHRNNTTTSPPSSSPENTIQSPTKSGLMRPDRHWILKTPRHGAGFTHPYRPDCVAHPVTTDEVSFDLWQESHQLSLYCESGRWEDRMLGRRCNDEVELFLPEDGEEFAALRGCLEERGFSVRAYVQQGKKRVRGTTVLREGVKALVVCVREMEFDSEVKVEFGLLVEVVGPRKVLAVVRVDGEMFERLRGREGTVRMGEGKERVFQTDDGPKELGRVLGGIRNTNDVRFWVEDEIVKTYFDGMGFLNEAPEFVNLVSKRQQEELEWRRKEKKAAKKHRRMVTESTTSASATTPSEMSFGSPLADEDEVVKARQRAKQNEKRKKQQQRRREDQAAEAAEEEKERKAKHSNRGPTITIKNLSDSEDSKSDSSSGSSSNWQLDGKISNQFIYHNGKGGLQFRQLDLETLLEGAARKEREKAEAEAKVEAQARAKVEEVDDDSDDEAKKPKVKLPKPEAEKARKDSVKDSSEDDDGGEGGPEIEGKGFDEVVYATTMEELRPLINSGMPLWVANPQDDNDVLKGWTMQYLGRGL